MKPSNFFSSITWENRKNYKMKYSDQMQSSSALLIFVFLLTLHVNVFGQEFFNYKKYLFDPPSSLSLNIEEINRTTGYVRVNGYVSGGPMYISWDWGDGNFENGWFPMTHTYADISQNYTVWVIANYSGGLKDTAEILIRFIPPSIVPITLSDTIAVHIPDNDDLLDTLGTRLYPPPITLTFFNDNFFQIIPRSTLEYVLTASAEIQRDFVNYNLFLIYGKFEQYMFRDSTFNGAYSLWCTNPVAFGVGDVLMNISIDYSSLFHEMGHNVTFNTPPNFYYGGRIDGNAYAIYAESLAQIMQHSTGYEIVNDYDYYGLSEDLMIEIRQEVIRTMKFVRNKYEQFLTNGKPFASWNDPSTQEDETLLTFMTIAYKFCEHAENSGQGYLLPTKRMMTLLQGFCQEWADRYDPLNNTAAADTFRSTLMVTALSYAFSSDLRNEFRNLNFPIDDETYDMLINSVNNINNDYSDYPTCFELSNNYPNPFNPSTSIQYAIVSRQFVTLKVYDILGNEIAMLVNEELPAGTFEVEFHAETLPSGIYFYQLKAGSFIETKKMVLLR